MLFFLKTHYVVLPPMTLSEEVVQALRSVQQQVQMVTRGGGRQVLIGASWQGGTGNVGACVDAEVLQALQGLPEALSKKGKQDKVGGPKGLRALVGGHSLARR